MQKGISLLVIALLLVTSLFSQVDSIETRKALRKARPVFIGIAAGLSFSNLRDFATSPLIYKGAPLYLSLNRSRFDRKRQSELGLSYLFGNYFVDFNDNVDISNVKTSSIYYSQLYRINRVSSEKWNFLLGGVCSFLGNYRVNDAFQNNSLGVEVFSNLLVSGKVSRDLTTEEIKSFSIWFINFTIPKRSRELTFRLNLGLLNTAYRNGYIYTRTGGLIGTGSVFSGYEFLTGGARLNSELVYTTHLPNKNAIRVGYAWDMLKSPDEYDQLEMAWHTFKIALLFNTNNK